MCGISLSSWRRETSPIPVGGGVTGLPPHDTARKSTGEALDMDGRGYGGGRREQAIETLDTPLPPQWGTLSREEGE